MLTVLRQKSFGNCSGASTRRFVHTTLRRRGYIVLVPEIGEDAHAADGILRPDGLPAFNDITIDNCLGAVGYQATAVEQAVKRIEGAVSEQSAGPQLETKRIFQELDEVSGPLETTWGIAKALYLGNSTLIPTKMYMNIHERARNARSSKYNSKQLYSALEQQEPAASGNEKRLLQKYLLEGKLNGIMLSKDARENLKDVILTLGKERANFKNKVNMSVHSFAHSTTDFQLLRNFPMTLLEAVAKDPHQPTRGPWKITLQPQIVEGFLKYCPDRKQRWNVWQANVRKASSQMEKSLENSVHLEKIRSLRQRQANILGYPSFAAMSMQTKMVQSVDNLKKIFTKLLQFAGPAQSVELAQLQEFALANGFEHKLELFDVSYWQRKYLLSQHSLNEELLREYFPLPRVLDGMFALSEQLFNIKIVERKDAGVWQSAVKYYDVYDGDGLSSGARPVGGFYADCYSKENKFGKNNGWMVSIRNRNQAADLSPLCALIFNFTEPDAHSPPYLLNFEDLRMVFKTFGTALQHLLTQAVYSDLAGISNIEWDASQVAGNVMCNFLDNPTVLKSISGHYSKGEPIPDQLANDAHLLKTHMAGYNLCQELYLADLDVELHQSTTFWLDVVKRLWPVYRCMPLDKRDSHPCSMTDIFSGDWGAAQFSHLYSKVIAADITDAFNQDATANGATVGKRFKQTFLASGGSVPTAEVFRRFRGRDPSVEALLKSLHILHETQTTGEL